MSLVFLLSGSQKFKPALPGSWGPTAACPHSCIPAHSPFLRPWILPFLCLSEQVSSCYTALLSRTSPFSCGSLCASCALELMVELLSFWGRSVLKSSVCYPRKHVGILWELLRHLPALSVPVRLCWPGSHLSFSPHPSSNL